MTHKSLAYRLTSITNCLSLVLQLLYPGLFMLASSVEAAGVPAATIGFDGGKNSFKINVSTSQEVKYSLSYSRTDGPTETINGTETQAPQFEKEIYAGTCSNGTCVPHQVNKGLLHWSAGVMQGAIVFVVDHNSLSVKSTYGIDKLDLTPDEEKWLNETDASPPTSSLAAPTVETPKECLAEGASITTVGDWAWKIDNATGLAETKEVVKLGVKYVFPQNNNVSVTFSCLPKDESLRTSLKIQQVKTTDLKLPTDLNTVGEYAYDITTGMEDGSFNYDVTLPKAVDSDAQISFIEKSIDTAKNYQIANVEVQQIEESKLSQDGSVVKASGIDHFTIYLSTYESNLSTSKTVYRQGEIVYVKNYINVQKDKDIYYRVDIVNPSGSSIANSACYSNIHSLEYSYQTSSLDPVSSNWYARMTKYASSGDCQAGTNAVDSGATRFQLIEGIISNPTLTQGCGLDIALVLDVSGSINSTELSQMKTAFKSFVDALSGTPTQFSVTKFDTRATVLQPFTSDFALVKTRIDAAGGGGYTNWQDGFVKTNSTLPNRINPNLVIFASDGNPNRTGTSGTSVTESVAVADAVTVANTIKSGGTRILALGIGSDLDSTNMKAISGPNMDTGSVLTSDVISTNFSTLASQLATFATQTCGGTITVHKTITGEVSPVLSGWHFAIGGQDHVTDDDGYVNIPVSAGTYSVVETQQNGYSLSSATCTRNGNASVGTSDILVGASDIISCEFVNVKNAECGDGEINQVSEQCDDGNQVNTDTCTNDCVVARCGDGFVQSGVEACDDGNTVDTDACRNNCTTAICGDGVVQAGVEACDDGNRVDNDTCSNSCTANVCGDGVVNQFSEQCDLGASNTDVACTPNYGESCNYCTASCQNASVTGPYCGDGLINGTEQCDGSDLGGLPTSDFTCSRCSLELINPKVTICHATSSNSNPYIVNQPSKTGDVSGHAADNGPVWFPGITVTWGDIIPPFYYVGGYFPGLNWTEGQAIWNAGCNVPKGTLVVKKVVVGSSESPTSFSFSVNGTAATSFEADGQNDLSVDPGTYTVTEPTMSDYVTTYDNCTRVSVTKNQSTTCTITNTKKARLTVVKVVTNNNGGTKRVVDFPLFVNGSAVTSGTSNLYAPGTYTITETGDRGYLASFSADCPNGSITLAAGESKTCTITNDDIAPTLTLKKVVDNKNVGTAQPANWTLQAAVPAGGPSFSGQGPTVGPNVVTAGVNYVLTEYGGPLGYSPSLWSCNGGTVSTNFVGDQQIQLPLAANVTCTITNTRDTALLTVIKQVMGSSALPSLWTMHIMQNSTDVVTPFLGSLTGTTFTLGTGTYSVSETGSVLGYTLSYSNDCSSTGSVTLAKNDRKTCRLINTRDTGTVVAHKFEDNNANQSQDAGENSLSGWEMKLYNGGTCSGSSIATVSTGSNGNADFGSRVTGSYSVKETLKTGWKNTTSLCQSVTVTKDATSTIDFGNYKMGSITIKKITNPGSLESFTYRGTLGTHTFYNNDSDRYNNLEIGTYTITEDQENGWYLSNLVCDYGSVSVENRTATVSLTAGMNATCTFTNTKYGIIHGEKFNDLNGNNRYDLIPYEPFLNGWRIFLDENNNGAFDEGERFDITHDRYWLFGWFDLGDYRFDNLVPGDYRVCEEMQTGWFPTSGTTCYTTTIRPGDVDIIQFANRQTGSISIQKFEDMNGNGIKDTDEVGGRIENWEMGVYAGSGCTGQVIANGFKNTDSAGVALFENLIVGNYSVKETLEDSNWINTTGSCLNVTVNPGTISYVDVGNFEKGEISVHKYNDMNGNGVKDEDERYLPDWTINLELSGSASSSAVTNTDGLATFAGLSAGTYLVSETNKPGWTLTNIDCGEVKNDELIALKSELDNDNNHEVIVRSGSSFSCDIGNQYNTPDLKIKKHNDRWPNSQAPGSDVHYTIVLTALENPVDHPFVRDLLPKNIKYRPGSYKVVSSLSGDLTTSVAAPTYASPGTWTLPGMVAGEELTLTYTGDVDGDIKPGTYKDVAWAQGTWTSGEGDTTHSLTADSVDSGYTDPGVVSSTFVGTKVLVDRNTNDNRHMDVIKEEQRGGLVLGATTELPGTGQPTLYALLAFGLLTVGGGLQLMTRKMRRKHD